MPRLVTCSRLAPPVRRSRSRLARVMAGLALAWSCSAVGADGAEVFDKNCRSCHDNKATDSGAPQLADAADWKERLGVGREELHRRAIEGFQGYFTMPPKGGFPELTDADVKAAVDWILERVSAH